jgi:O-antigen ligase
MVLSKIINRNLLIGLVSSLLMGVLIAYNQYILYIPLVLILFLIILLKISRNHVYNLMILLLPIMVYFNIGLTFNISFSDVLLPIAALVTLPIFMRTKGLVFTKFRFVLFYMYVLIVVLAFSFLKPMLFHINVFEMGTAITNVMKIVINFLYTSLFLIYFLNNEKSNREKSLTFLKVWNIVSVLFSLLCIIGVVLHYLGIPTTFTSDYRATGTFEDPNLAAAYLIISLGFCLVYNHSRKSLTTRIPFNLFIIIFALLLTSSRGGVLGLGLGFIFVILINLTNKGIRQITKIVAVFIMISAVIFIINFIYPLDFINTSLERITNVGSDESGTSLRLLLWKTALTLWQDNPFLGVGFGQYLANAHHLNSSIVNIPHNTYLSFLAETGIIGFISFFSLPIYLFFKLFKLIKTGDTVSIFLFVSFSGIMVQAFTINLENFRCIWVFYAFVLYWTFQGANHVKKDKT